MAELRTAWDYATAALRGNSPSILRGGLVLMLRAYDGKDARDLMIALAPLHDCARRLGLNVAEFFRDAADVVGGEAGEIARSFGRRSDISPSSFAYSVRTTPDGPEYRSYLEIPGPPPPQT